MAITVRSVFENCEHGKTYVEKDDLKRVATDAKVNKCGIGPFNALDKGISKIWEKLAPNGEAQLTWEKFKAQAAALIPASVSGDPAAATKKAQELFAAADTNPHDDKVTCDELADAIKSKSPLKGPLGVMAAQLTFALLGIDRDRTALSKPDFDGFLTDVQKEATSV